MKGKSAVVVKWALIVSLIGLIALAEWQLRLSTSLGPDQIQEWLKSSGPLAPVVFILTMATAVVVSPIPSLPLDLVAGSFFGPLRGTLYASAGGLLGAMISFLLARFLGRELLQRVP